jgi:hypothetical protein
VLVLIARPNVAASAADLDGAVGEANEEENDGGGLAILAVWVGGVAVRAQRMDCGRFRESLLVVIPCRSGRIEALVVAVSAIQSNNFLMAYR